MTPPASSCSFSFSFTYDVFLSFRGSDTRYGFTGNLHKALSDIGIRTFIDDEELQKGEEITPTLLKAIEESRIAIVVFSKNYASSTFCLKELAKIIECVKHKGRLVWPVFYEVDPSDLRHIKGRYGKAMGKHESRFKNDREKPNKWKSALREAANLSGSHFKQGIEYEHIFIERIVKEISKRTDRIILPIADYPVGMESRVQKLASLLEVGSNEEVIMVGIYGIGGIGKTTIARAIYNLFADKFDSVCFLANVRDNSLVQLQGTMLSKIVGEKDIKLTDVYEGISIIKKRLSKKRMFLILDDIDKRDQLNALAGKLDWFGLGSRIIITTRNEHLLRGHGITRKYEVKTLSDAEGRELFTWHAFKGKDFDPSYLDVLNSIVLYCSGLPLALEVIGCHLFDKTLDEWKSAFCTYENIPEKTIQQILKISYDDLGDIEKEIFLDMACFFKGHRLKYAEDVLSNSRGIPPTASIGALKDRSLIKIHRDDSVWMHDLIEEMGKEIVRKESPLEPGRRSRLWFQEDIIQVFEENTGTDNIEAIVLHSNGDTKVHWNGNALKKMIYLRILIIKNVSFSKGPKYLPNNLRYLDWEKYPSSTLSFDSKPKKIAILKLKDSCLTSFKSLSNFKLLSEINLEGSKFLNRVPDISEAASLRRLNLVNCINLIEVDISVGNLDKLCYLRATGCTNLKIFPEVIKSTSLEWLHLLRCPSLERVPIMSGVMEKITEVYLYDYKIFSDDSDDDSGAFKLERWCSRFYLSIGLFKLPKVEKIIEGVRHLRKCRVQDNESVSLAFLSNIRSLNILGSNCPIANHSTWFPCCLRMEELEFFSNYSIYECLSSLVLCFPNLEELKLSSKFRHNDIPAWHPSLANLRAFVQKFNTFADDFVFTCLRWMPKLQELDLCSIDFTILPECINECHLLRILRLDYCKQLREIRGMPPNIEFLSAKECISLSAQSRSILLSQTLHKASTKEFVLPGTMIPKWFNHRQSTVESLSFWVRNKFPERIILSFVHIGEIQYYLLVDGIHCCGIQGTFYSSVKIPHIHLLHVLVGDEELTVDRWIRIEFSIVKTCIRDAVSCIGVHVYKKEKNSRKDVRFMDPNPKKSKVDKDMGDTNPNYHPSLKNWCPFLDMNFFGIHFPHWYLGNMWKMQALAKVKILMCQIEARCLPTCEYLFSRKVIKNPLCPICEAAYETIEHAFLDCPWTLAVWFGSDLQWNIIDLNYGGFFVEEWIKGRLWNYENLDYAADINVEGQSLNKIMGIVGNICWAIWKERNEYILEGKPVDPTLALLTIKTLYNQYQAHSYPLFQNISYPTSEITDQGDDGASWPCTWTRLLEMGESSSQKEEVGLSYNRAKGKSILIAGNSNDKAKTGCTLDLDSTIHNVETEEV